MGVVNKEMLKQMILMRIRKLKRKENEMENEIILRKLQINRGISEYL